MTSRAFSCNKSLIRKNLSRFWLLSLSLLLILLINGVNHYSILLSTPSRQRLNEIVDNIASMNGMVEFFSSIVAAVCVFSYLHHKRGSSFFRSLPIDSDGLFLSSYLSGLLLYLLPWVAVTVVTTPLIASLVPSTPALWTYYLGSMCFRLVLYLVSYTLGVYAMIFCGRAVFAVLVTLTLHVLFPFLENLLRTFLEPCLYGIPVDLDPISEPLAPFLYLIGELLLYEPKLPWLYMGIYSATSLVLIYPALLLHRRRKEECVGQTLVFPFLYGIAQYLLTFVLGFILLGLVALPTIFIDLIDGIRILGFGYLFLCPIVAFFLVRMLLLRSRKVFQKKAFLHCGLFLLVVAVVFVAFNMDLFHIVRRLPQAEKVQEVCLSLDDMDYVSQDPEVIRDLIEIHSHVIEERNVLQTEYASGVDRTDYIYTMDLTYTMTNGRTMERTYWLSYHFADPESQALWHELESFFLEGDRATEQLLQLQELVTEISYALGDKRPTMSTGERNAFFRALEQDLETGLTPIPLIYITTDYQKNRVFLFTEDNSTFRLYFSPSNALKTFYFLQELTGEYTSSD